MLAFKLFFFFNWKRLSDEAEVFRATGMPGGWAAPGEGASVSALLTQRGTCGPVRTARNSLKPAGLPSCYAGAGVGMMAECQWPHKLV